MHTFLTNLCASLLNNSLACYFAVFPLPQQICIHVETPISPSIVRVRVRDFDAILPRFWSRFWLDSRVESYQNRVDGLTTPRVKPILGSILSPGTGTFRTIPMLCTYVLACTICFLTNKYASKYYWLPTTVSGHRKHAPLESGYLT